MQKFYENTIIFKLIKSILADTYLPTMSTCKPGDYIVQGYTYATYDSIIKCKKSGYYRIPTYDREEGQKIAEVDKVSTYLPGRFYPKFTEAFIAEQDFYDTKIHEWLGRYLRFLRDIKEVDLMPYYNLFSESYIPNMRIDEDGPYSIVQDLYKVAKIPIKYNKTYTIAIDCPSQVWVCPIFLAKDNILVYKGDTGDSDISITEKFLENRNLSITKVNTSFKDPFTFSVPYKGKTEKDEYDYYQFERNLYMLIQIPANNQSSIVILEGDYTNSNSNPNNIINMEELNSKITNHKLNDVLTSKLTLLQMNNQVKYPFSNRLIEYLLGNAIDCNEENGDNVERIQKRLPFTFLNKFVYGVWDKYTRVKSYRNSFDSQRIELKDINGYIDKDSEKLY